MTSVDGGTAATTATGATAGAAEDRKDLELADSTALLSEAEVVAEGADSHGDQDLAAAAVGVLLRVLVCFNHRVLC